MRFRPKFQDIPHGVFIALLGFVIALGTWATVFYGVHERAGVICVAVAMAVVYLIAFSARPKINPGISLTARILFWIFAVLFFPWAVTRQYFGEVTVNAFIFHLSEDLASGIQDDTLVVLIAASVLIFVYIHAIYLFLTLSRQAGILLIAAALTLAALNPVSAYIWDKAVYRLTGGLEPVTPFAVDPVITQAPSQPRNLVIVYLEGLEATYENDVFGDVYEPVASLRETALEFSNVGQLPMTEWSVAGLVASQCGLPTVPRGVRRSYRMDDADQAFMTERDCLGDLLSGQGYQVEMVLGAQAVFGGFEGFLRSHSYDQVLDVWYLKERGATDRGAWGYHDSEVFKAGLERLRQLEAADKPYALSVFTIGPHGPRGYLADACREDGMPDTVSDVLPSVKCTGQLALEFVTRARDIVDPSTLFVVMSDHLAHPMVSATPQLKLFQRRNTVLFLGGEETPRAVGKSGTLVDVFPTMLEALGYQIKGRRAGLGVSLLSDQSPFAEGQDRKTIRQRFGQDVEFARWLWSEGS